MAEHAIRILLIEDNPTDIFLLREMLTGFPAAPFSLTVVERLAEGLRDLSQEAFDVVLLDLGLPDSQGLETLMKLQAQVPHVPIVVLTGLSDEVMGLRALQAGAQDYLVKGQVEGNGLARAIRYAIERQRADEAVRKSEAFNRSVLNSLSESVIITDTAGTILYINPAFERTSGYSQAEAFGQNPRLFKSDQHDAAFFRELWATISIGQVWRGRFINKRKDGALYIEDATITPIRDDKGAMVNYVSVQRDITRELQLEEQHRQAQKMEAIGRLSGGIAHDFNNLLVVITGYSDLLLDHHLDQDDPVRNDVKQIKKAGERAAALTRQLLAFSRQQVMQPKIIDLNMIVADMEKMLQRLIGEDIELVTFLAKDLGQVKADPNQIEQVILNLAINARDAMPNGGKLTIETANVELDETYVFRHMGLEPGFYVMLTVSDAGIGMDKQTLANIFDPFFTTKEQGKGTGLGLATVYGIVKQSGGDIWVYSEPEQGTTFKIYLPQVFKPTLSSETQPDLIDLPAATETVLLVEDEEAVRTLTRNVLEMNGYTVIEARHGGEALRLTEQQLNPIHLLLTDVVMPGGLNGRGLAEQLRSIRPGLKVLYISGYTDDAIIRHGVLEPGVHFLQKPFTPAALVQKVRQVLDATVNI